MTDYISTLPDPIIHHILFHLPLLEAINTSLLSRAWKDLWMDLPIFSFDKSFFDRNPQCSTSQFLKFLVQSLAKQSKYFVTNIGSLNDPKTEELVLNNTCIRPIFEFSIINAYLPTRPLKRLELRGIALDSDLIECLSKHCPFMERLCFHHYDALNSLKVSGFPKLVEFVFSYNNPNFDESHIKLEIDVPNLRLLEYTTSDYSGEIEAYGCKSLERIWLHRVNITSHWSLSFLSSLTLKLCCYEKQDFVLSSKSLKTLCLYNCYYLRDFKFKIDTPNLKYFEFSGDLPPLFELNHNGLEKAIFHENVVPNLKYVDFFAKINPCKELEILAIRDVEFYRIMEYIIEPELRQNWISCHADVEHITLRLCWTTWIGHVLRPHISSFVDTLLWLSPSPLTLKISLYRSGHDDLDQEFKILKFKYYEREDGRGKKDTDVPRKGWRDHLKEVVIENHGLYKTVKKGEIKRAEDDHKLKAFFENARGEDKIVVNIIS